MMRVLPSLPNASPVKGEMAKQRRRQGSSKQKLGKGLAGLRGKGERTEAALFCNKRRGAPCSVHRLLQGQMAETGQGSGWVER